MTVAVRTYLDSNVIIRAAKAAHELDDLLVQAAWRLLNESNREFVVSALHDLELLPGTRALLKRLVPDSLRARRVALELAFYEDFLASAKHRVELSPSLTKTAMELSESALGLSAADALHVAAATTAKAEFVTSERTEKPLFSLTGSGFPIRSLSTWV